MMTRPRPYLVLLGAGILLTSVLLLASCSERETAPTVSDAQVVELVATAQAAHTRVRQILSDAVLRQLDYSSTGDYTFRFTDPEATQGINIFASSSVPPEQWRLVVSEVSPLLGHPSQGVNLQSLGISPVYAERLAEAHWQRGTLRSLSLSGDEQDLYW